ncbi:MAG TPA: hypothetical protein PLR02_13125 [Rhodocyclaceae bacterium]|nr:hypothetical protein [Rhodocyclaceae bacterium]
MFAENGAPQAQVLALQVLFLMPAFPYNHAAFQIGFWFPFRKRS